MEKFYNRTAADRKGGKGGFRGGKPPFKKGPGKFSSRGADERPAMHPATCSVCGASCEVPFVPNGRKPILCRNCYKKSEMDEARTFDRPRPASGKPPYVSTPRTGTEGIEKQLKALNQKIDMLIEALLEPEEDEDEDGDGADE